MMSNLVLDRAIHSASERLHNDNIQKIQNRLSINLLKSASIILNITIAKELVMIINQRNMYCYHM